MLSPFIFIATNRLKPGQLDRERKRVPGLVEFIGASEPRLIAFNEYVNEAGAHPSGASRSRRLAAEPPESYALPAMVKLSGFHCVIEGARSKALKFSVRSTALEA